MTLFRKILPLITLSIFVFSCTKEETKIEKVKIGMVTDSGSIDDKSFNQGTWEGILKAQKGMEITTKYLKPTGSTEADYLKEIGNLYDAGYKVIITPGFKFATSIYKAQKKYKDAQFILLDAAPHSGDNKTVMSENTVSIFFAEQESGFIAGIAAAVELKTGSFGFIGGMEIPPVQKFNWGFQQGVIFANENYKTNIELLPENIIYQGTFSDIAAGQQLAAQMYDRGVNAIFCAAGGVGIGAINEAKSRAINGEIVWVIGVDVDQYTDGIYQDDNSVILTSAVKRIDNAAYKMIKLSLEDKFPGGEILMFDSKNFGVGIPDVNKNLSESTSSISKLVYEMLQKDKIKVSAEQGNLLK